MSQNVPTTDNQYANHLGLVYVRVSTKRQEKEGNGLQSQEKRCVEFLASVNIPHEKTFHDSYTGGGEFMKRQAMKELLSYIDRNPAKRYLVVFDDLKRFARDLEFHLKLRATFRSRKVILHCLNYNFDESPEGRFIEVIHAAQGQLELEQNKRQVVQKMAARLSAGYWSFPGKLGYRIVKRAAHGKIAVPDPKNGYLLAEGLNGFASGRFPRPIDACKFLVESGFWNRRAERYTQKFITILKDPFYAGFIEYPAWGITRRKGKHKALITYEVFSQNKAKLTSPVVKNISRVDTSEDFIFRGLIICPACGGNLTGTWANGRSAKYAYYFCQKRNCTAFRKNVRAEDVTSFFKAAISSRPLSDIDIKPLKRAFEKLWRTEKESLESLKAQHEQKRRELEKKIQNLTNLVIDVSSDTLRNKFQEELEKKINELSELEDNPTSVNDAEVYRTAFEATMVFLKDPYYYWSNADLALKRQLFLTLFGGKVAFEINPPYRTLESPYFTKIFWGILDHRSPDVEMPGKISNHLRPLLKKFWDIYQTSLKLHQLLSSTGVSEP